MQFQDSNSLRNNSLELGSKCLHERKYLLCHLSWDWIQTSFITAWFFIIEPCVGVIHEDNLPLFIWLSEDCGFTICESWSKKIGLMIDFYFFMYYITYFCVQHFFMPPVVLLYQFVMHNGNTMYACDHSNKTSFVLIEF